MLAPVLGLALTLLPKATPQASLLCELLADPQGHYTIAQITRAPLAGKFMPADRAPPVSPSDVYWLRFRLVRSRSAEPLWYLVGDRGARELELYIPEASGTFRVLPFGEATPFSARPVPARDPQIVLPPEALDGRTLYLRIQTYGNPPDIPSLVSASAVYRQWVFDTKAALFIGFLVAIGLGSSFLAVRLRERIYAYNALLMFITASALALTDGLSDYWLWPDWRVNPLRAYDYIWAAHLLALLLFARSFLQLHRQMPRADRLLIGIFIAAALYLLYTGMVPHSALAVFPGGYWQPVAISQYLAMFALLVVAILSWHRGLRAARFFTVGFFGLLFLLLYNDSTLYRFVPRFLPPIFSSWGMELAFTFDAAMFQLALADRFLLERRARERAQAERIETLESYARAVERFVPRPFLNELMHEDIRQLRLGDHVEREMTVLFADIRDFTALAESLTPQEAFEFLNAYFSRAGPAVRTHGGFIDKYIGDALMALFPGPPDAALAAAIALARAAADLPGFRKRADPALAVGVNRGRLMLGTIGEKERFETTVIADAVNVASRLQDAAKFFGCAIVTSAQTVKALAEPQRFRLRRLGTLEVKGKSQGLEAFECYDSDPEPLAAHKHATLRRFEEALAAFERGDLAVARAQFGSLLAAHAHDGAARYYWARCAEQKQ